MNRDQKELVSRAAGARVSFNWTPERGALGTNSLSLSRGSGANPLSSALSETLHTARQNANSLVLYAKQNPGLQRLVTGYEEWESNLRREASARLGGFQPLRQVFTDNGLAEDWGLLRRVKSSSSLYGASLKRSASDNSLSSAAEGVRKPAKQRVHLSSDWDLFSALNGPSAAELGNYRPPARHGPGLPRVATESSLELDGTGAFASSDAARNLEAVAVTILQTSKQALATAQQSLQETANNCSQNLQSLTVLLQQNLPVQAPSVVQQIVRPAQPAAGGAAQGSGALVPWSVLPRYLRAREFAAEMYDNQDEQKENYNILEQMQEYLDNLQVTLRLLGALARALLVGPGGRWPQRAAPAAAPRAAPRLVLHLRGRSPPPAPPAPRYAGPGGPQQGALQEPARPGAPGGHRDHRLAALDDRHRGQPAAARRVPGQRHQPQGHAAAAVALPAGPGALAGLGPLAWAAGWAGRRWALGAGAIAQRLQLPQPRRRPPGQRSAPSHTHPRPSHTPPTTPTTPPPTLCHRSACSPPTCRSTRPRRRSSLCASGRRSAPGWTATSRWSSTRGATPRRRVRGGLGGWRRWPG
jgi:hypothetical protein